MKWYVSKNLWYTVSLCTVNDEGYGKASEMSASRKTMASENEVPHWLISQPSHTDIFLNRFHLFGRFCENEILVHEVRSFSQIR